MDYQHTREFWIELIEYPGYAISSLGRVMNTHTDLIKHPAQNQQGIMMVNFSIRSKQYVRSVALLIAEAFVSRNDVPEHFDTPIHLNGDRCDCRADNLLWRPRWFARKYHQQFSEWERENRGGFRVPVELIDTSEVFDTSWEAAIKYGLLDSDIFVNTMNDHTVFPYNFKFRIYG